jgi:hypothetical protein
VRKLKRTGEMLVQKLVLKSGELKISRLFHGQKKTMENSTVVILTLF